MNPEQDNNNLVNWRLDRIDKELINSREDLKDVMLQGFAQLNERIDKMDTRVEKVEDKVDNAEKWKTATEVRLTTLENKIDNSFQFSPRAVTVFLSSFAIVISILAIVVSKYL